MIVCVFLIKCVKTIVGKDKMFLRDAVLLEARSPLSRFGVHGMRDPTGMIAEMLYVPEAITLCLRCSGFARLMRDRAELVIISEFGTELGRIADTGAVNLELAVANGRLTLSGMNPRPTARVRLVLWTEVGVSYGDARLQILYPDTDGNIRDGYNVWRVPFVAAVHVGSGATIRLAVLFRDGRISQCRYMGEIPKATLVK